MKKKHKITLLVIGILLALSLMLSSSYALWVFNVSQESTNVLVSDCFELTLSDNNPIGLGASFPMRDSDGVKTTPYTFNISNNCNYPADIEINLETLNASTLNESNIKVDFNGHIKKYNELEPTEVLLNDSKGAVKLFSDTINSKINKTRKYNLRLWIDEDANTNEIENKLFLSKLSVRGTLRKEYKMIVLTNGMRINSAFRVLSGEENTGTFSYTFNTTITAIRRSLTPPTETDNVKNLMSSSNYPVYAWFDNGTIYLYFEAEKLYLNSDSYGIFGRLKNLEYIDTSFFDTSYLQDAGEMFYGASKLQSLDLSHFDTSKVTNMKWMLCGLNSLTSLDVSNFDTSKVTDMSYMFSSADNLTNLDLSHFDTSKVTNMKQMFGYNSSLTSIDLSGFNTSNVTDMSNMFRDTNMLMELDVSHFDTSNVTDMSNMFRNSDKLEILDLSSFDTSKVTNMSYMFNDMNSLKTIYASDMWNTTSVTSGYSAFANSSNLVGGAGTIYDFNHTNKEYARVDDPQNDKPGYFTLKEN